MCYLLREQQAGAAQPGGETLPSNEHRLRPRLAGVLAAALIGGLALAALTPSGTPPLSKDGAAAPVSRAAVVPATAAVERSVAPVADDGVPTDTGVAKAAMGECHHGL